MAPPQLTSCCLISTLDTPPPPSITRSLASITRSSTILWVCGYLCVWLFVQLLRSQLDCLKSGLNVGLCGIWPACRGVLSRTRSAESTALRFPYRTLMIRFSGASAEIAIVGISNALCVVGGGVVWEEKIMVAAGSYTSSGEYVMLSKPQTPQHRQQREDEGLASLLPLLRRLFLLWLALGVIFVPLPTQRWQEMLIYKIHHKGWSVAVYIEWEPIENPLLNPMRTRFDLKPRVQGDQGIAVYQG